MRAVDTNVLVRAFMLDDEEQSARALEVLGKGEVFVPVSVVLELEWVLRSRYGVGVAVVADTIANLCDLEGVSVGEADAVRTAAAWHRGGLDFADALHRALSAGCEDFLTFDDRLVKRSARSRGGKPRVRAVP